MSYVCFFVRVVQAACLAARLAAPAVTCELCIQYRSSYLHSYYCTGPVIAQLAVRM